MVDYTTRPGGRPASGGGVALFVVSFIAVVILVLAFFDSRGAGSVPSPDHLPEPPTLAAAD